MARNGRQFTLPLFIEQLENTQAAQTLSQLPLGKSAGKTLSHDEWWLQKLIFQFPKVLPINEIEPGFSPLIPACIEMPTKAGSVDNLFITNEGDLVLAECKLWRNPEARRKVVAQIIDYAHSMASWTYSDIDLAYRKASLPDGGKPEGSLYALVDENEGLDEASFVDAISRNLRLGRMLLLIVGDGIREGVETLTGYLQMHAGFHFTLSILELPVFELPTSGYVVHPRILAKTTNIERGIVRIENELVKVDAQKTEPSGEGRNISEARIMEILAESNSATPHLLRIFLSEGADYGVFMEAAGKSLQLRWRSPDDQIFSLGGISSDGRLLTYNIGWYANEIGNVGLAHQYLEDIANVVGGNVKQTKNPEQWYVVERGTQTPPIAKLLNRRNDWLDAIQKYTGNLSAEIKKMAQ